MLNLLAGFTSPMDIGTTPSSVLWVFPLLLAISIIYKATKLKVIFTGKFIRETAILFATISVVMVAISVGLHILVWLITS